MFPSSKNVELFTAKLVGRGRYRLEAELGHGGAAAVYRAVELGNGRACAFKRLAGQPGPRVTSLFEFEYHVLASLQHPNIVDVYDYGTDEAGPYYVMELLEGSDLNAVRRSEWRTAAGYVREVAAALSVLHARKLLHRDVSARNVWRLPTGHIKLIDFGALSAFGTSGHVVGTPPHVAPEAIYGRPLDQRTDLYGLGALLYWLLTGTHAFPAHNLRDLPALWTEPPLGVNEQLARFAATAGQTVPVELDVLVMSMLSENPMARPGTTGEVIDRLSILLGAESRPQGTSELTLPRPQLVERAEERKEFGECMELLRKGRGTSILYEGARGAGRSRLLLELAADARISGLCVLSVDARQCVGAHAVAEALLQRLLDAVPDLAEEAARPWAPALGQLSERIRERLGEARPSSSSTSVRSSLLRGTARLDEGRAKLHEALTSVFAQVAQKTPLVLLVDDLERADEGSIAWLTGLAERCAKLPIALGLGWAGAAASEDFVLKALRAHSHASVLKPLGADGILKLLSSLFGEVPHLLRLAERIHKSTRRLPGQVMEIAQRLVRDRAITHVDGTWVLPQDIAAEQLRLASEEAFETRLARLSPAARALAAQLSVRRGLIRLEMCRVVSPLPAKELFDAVAELVAENVLTIAQGGYLFSDAALSSTLSRELSKDDARFSHGRLAELLLGQGPLSPAEELEALVHRMESGDVVDAPRRIVRASMELRRLEPDKVAEAVPVLEHALQLFRALGKRDADLIALLGPLTASGFFSNRQLLARYSDAALAATSRAVGVDVALALLPWLGKRLALALGLLAGVLRTRFGASCAPSFRERMEIFFDTVTAFAAASAASVDPEAIARCVQLTSAFSALGTRHVAGFMHAYLTMMLALKSDHPAVSRAGWRELIALLDTKGAVAGLTDAMQLRSLGGALYMLGLLESWRDDGDALPIADRLDALQLSVYEMMADQVRTVYYAHQGNKELHDVYRQRAELHAIRRGSAWQVEAWAPGAASRSALRTFDAMALKEACEQLRRLERDIPSIRVTTKRAQGNYLYLRKRYAEALTVFDGCLEAEREHKLVGWTGTQGNRAACLNRLGEHARAKQVIQDAMAQSSPADLDFPGLNLALEAELAEAEAGLGNLELAASMVDGLLAKHGPRKGALTLGLLHQVRANVALLAGDELKCQFHGAEMERHYLGTQIPSLVAHCARLARKRARALAPTQSSADGAQPTATSSRSLDTSSVGGYLPPTKDASTSSAEHALQQLMQQTGSTTGALFVLRDDVPVLAARRGGSDAYSSSLQDWVKERLDHARAEDVTQTEIACNDNANDPSVLTQGEARFRFFALVAASSDRMRVAGALVLSERADAPVNLPLSVLHVTTSGLCDALEHAG